MAMYKIVRYYIPGVDGSNRPSRTIKKGLTLKQAQEHCNNPKTIREGVWFDGYQEIK